MSAFESIGAEGSKTRLGLAVPISVNVIEVSGTDCYGIFFINFYIIPLNDKDGII